jgi:glycolate oxidase FAD binding subunit
LNLARLQETIRDAAATQRPLLIRGGGSKDFYGNAPHGEPLDTRGHAGIVAYEPTELVVTARCGTLLSDLQEVLSEKGQFLSFEPPSFGPGATLGGCVAAGLSGPRRAAAGSVRDAMLGAKIVDGRGQLLSFGGQVMKNVAGYDVSRLLAGSMGTLGLIVEASLKLLPRPAMELTRRFDLPQPQALEALGRWGGQPLPISASAWRDGRLALRFSGAQSAVQAAARKLGGESVPAEDAAAFWSGVREQTDTFFAGDAPLWRLSLPAQAPVLELAGEQLLEWGGCGCRDRSLGGIPRRRSRDAVPRSRQARGRLRAFAAVACAPAPRPEENLRSGGYLQSRPDVPGDLGLAEPFLLRLDRGTRLVCKRRLRIPRQQACVQLDSNRRLACFARLVRRLEEQFLRRHVVAGR